MKGRAAAPPFRFSKQWAHAQGEPHVVVVAGRSGLVANYNTEAADIIETAYAGGGWDKFVMRLCDAMRLGRSGMQIFTEAVSDRAREKPIVIYVGNAGALARDCGEDLVRYIGFWEGFAQFEADHAQPMLLALQMPPWR